MTDPQSSGDIETSSAGVGGWAIGDRLHLSPVGVDVAVAVGVFGVSVVNLAAQDAAGISEIPVAGFLMLAIGSVALFWRRSRSLAVLGVALAMTVAWMALGYPGNPVFLILASLYAVGRYVSEWRISLAALAAALAVVGFGQVTDGDSVSEVVTGLILTALSVVRGSSGPNP